MRLLIDTTNVQFTVGREPSAKTDQNSVQKQDRNTGFPLWTVQLVAMDDSGAEVINVAVAAAAPPKLPVGVAVDPAELQAIPWAQNGRNGVAYRASEFRQAGSGKQSSAAASAVSSGEKA